MKTKKTELKLLILTDDEYPADDYVEGLSRQSEQAAFYLMSIFNLIKTSARFNEAGESDEIPFFCNDLIRISEIGYSLCGLIWTSAENLRDFQNDRSDAPSVETDTIEPESSLPDAEPANFGTLDEADTDTLALALSEVLRNENLPIGIYNAINRAARDIHNETDTDVLIKFETSPEYLQAVFAAHVKKQNDDENDD